MNEEQAEKMINLLEDINYKLSKLNLLEEIEYKLSKLNTLDEIENSLREIKNVTQNVEESLVSIKYNSTR